MSECNPVIKAMVEERDTLSERLHDLNAYLKDNSPDDANYLLLVAHNEAATQYLNDLCGSIKELESCGKEDCCTDPPIESSGCCGGSCQS